MIRTVEKVQNKILRPVYQKVFFNILHHSFRFSLQSLQKKLIRPPKNCLAKKKFASKTQNCMLILDLLKVSPNKACKKGYGQNSQLKVHFLAFTHTLD